MVLWCGVEDVVTKDGKEQVIRKERKMLVRDALNAAINGIVVNANGQPLPAPPEDKGRIYQLSTKIWGAKKDVQLTSEEVVFIKKRAKEVSNVNPLLCGRICDLLEGKVKEDEKEPETNKA